MHFKRDELAAQAEEALCEKLIKLAPFSFLGYYDLACAKTRLGRSD